MIEPEWDAFISYASEDVRFAQKLAEALRDRRLKVWFDKFELKVGDRLEERIDEGLSRSRYGIVILSPSFFSNPWPRSELDALLSKERYNKVVILPVWYKITRQQVEKYSPILLGRVAGLAKKGIDEVATRICHAIQPDVTDIDELSAVVLDTPIQKRAGLILQFIARFTDPASYDVVIGERNFVSRQLFAKREEFSSLNDYYRSYARLLGFSLDRGPELFNMWLKELEEDPWWQEHFRSTGGLMNRPGFPPSPVNMLNDAFQTGDWDEIFFICGRAYWAGVVAKNRENLISIINTQPKEVQRRVCQGWSKMIKSDDVADWIKIFREPGNAFKVLQRITHIQRMWSV